MILKAEQIANLIESGKDATDPLVIAPQPNLDDFRTSGAASLDIRLGTWFAVPRQSRIGFFDIAKVSGNTYESEHVEMHYVPFDSTYILQPSSFVLGVTLEWIRLPRNLAGYVTARSSWGRRGLIIATAVGVHPGFTGCLSLELSNVGEIPIVLHPGMAICQLFIHQVNSTSESIDASHFVGFRRPILGPIELDDMAKKLGRK